MYHKTSNISHTSGNKMVDHSDVAVYDFKYLHALPFGLFEFEDI